MSKQYHLPEYLEEAAHEFPEQPEEVEQPTDVNLIVLLGQYCDEPYPEREHVCWRKREQAA